MTDPLPGPDGSFHKAPNEPLLTPGEPLLKPSEGLLTQSETLLTCHLEDVMG
jgi:hypothetical protein